MVRFEIAGSVDPLLAVHLERGDKVLAESNAMVAMDGDLALKGKSRGGLLKSIARKFLNDETFFQQYIEAEKEPGQVLLAPNIPGDIRILDVGERQYLLSDGAFLAATEDVELSVKSQGLGRALLGNNGGFFIMGTEGRGQLAVSGFGSIREIDVKPGQTML
ncbi:MAG: TIGR00266 family protein, partial [Burkholderiaceae bacterium]|nr:TIGR00266 family protein [Burkholderiaceae bacterium]